MGFDQPARHIQPDAGAAMLARGGAVQLEEALEQAGYVAREDARALVDDGHLELLAAVVDLDDDLAV